ncbi:MAG: FliG C-terminal domain-containing protein [Campylobacterota bacterium]
MASDTRKVAKILSRLGNKEAADILDDIAKKDPQLAQNIQKQLFVYEDLFDLGKSDLERLHQRIDQDDLVLALKGTGAALGAYILSAISNRRKKVVLQQMKELGKIKRSDAQEAKRRIADTAYQMMQNGDISLGDTWVE